MWLSLHFQYYKMTQQPSLSGCCFEQKYLQISPNSWNVSVTASDSRYNSNPSNYHAILSYPSSFSVVADLTPGNGLSCQEARVASNETGNNIVSCMSDNSDNFVGNFVLTSTAASNDTAAKFTALSVDDDVCSNVPNCNHAATLSATDVMIGSQIYPKWSVALTAVVIAAILLVLVTVTIRYCVNRQRALAGIPETDTEYSDYSRRPTKNSYLSRNEKAISGTETYSGDLYTDIELVDDIVRYRRESIKEADDRSSNIESAGSRTQFGELPSLTSFRKLNFLSTRTVMTSLPSLPSLPRLPSFNSMSFSLKNNSNSENSITDVESFRPTTDSSVSDNISESSVSVIGNSTETVNSRAAVEAYKVIRKASRKSKTRSTIFTEEHINKIFHLDEHAKHKSLTELYPQYGDIRSKSTTSLGSAAGITTSCPNSVRVKHREPTMLEGLQAALIERSMSASNVMDAQSDDNKSSHEDEIPFILSDHEEARPKARNRSSSLSQQFSRTCDDFGISKTMKNAAFKGRSLDSRGRQRQSACYGEAKRRSKSATPSAALTIRPRSFLLPRSVYDDDSSSDDNSDTMTRAKFQRRYRSLTRAGSQKSGSIKRKSSPTSCTSNTSDVNTIRKHLQASWKAEMAESPSHNSLNVDADIPALLRKQRRPALPEGFMHNRYSGPASMIEPLAEPAPPNDLTSQDSLDTLSSFVPEHGYTSEDTESISYSNAVSLAILQEDSISSGLSVLSLHKGKHEMESSVCGLHETNSESNRSFHSQQSISDLAIGDLIPSNVSFY
jgi:hypothetical protein